ncbi:barstar family protein [Actinomadura scrupuli]|uniref:barstar family protein n=1 Tax=Actinomadura scrupuli TaxID=559629 RepID=UPI003D988DA1
MSELGGLAGVLAGKTEPGVYLWTVPGSTRRADVVEAAQGAGWRPFWLAGQTVTDKEEFLEMSAEGLEFPDWFGHNWDALADCLTDLTWATSMAGYLIVYAGWQALAQEEPESFSTAIDILAEAVDLWRDTETPMTVLLPATGDEDVAPDLPLLH